MSTPSRWGCAVLAATSALTLLGTSAAAGTSPRVTRLYVAPWGSDAAAGTLAHPFATPAGAQRAVRARTARMAGDIVVSLRAGTYRLRQPLTLSAAAGDSGTHGHRVVYQPFGYGTAGQERVVLSGGQVVAHWRSAGAGRWRADVGDLRTRQLYVDGERAPRAALGHGLPGRVRRTDTGYVTDSALPRTWGRPADIEVVHTFGSVFSEGRCGVAAITAAGSGSAITMDQPCFRRALQTYAKNAEATGVIAPTNIENSPSFLRAGSWYLDTARAGHHLLTYRARTGESGPPRRVVAAAAPALVRGTGSAGRPLTDVTMRGLTFAHSTWLGPDRPTGFPQVIGNYYYVGDDPVAEKSLSIPGSVQFGHSRRITLADNRFTHLGAVAMEFTDGSRDLAVRGNVVEDVSGGGLQIDGPGAGGTDRGSTVENNLVRRVGVEYRGSWGIVLNQPFDSVIAHNDLEHLPYSGIVVLNSGGTGRTSGNNRVLDNRVEDSNNVLIDGGPIYLNGPQGTSFGDGALVRGNVVRDATNPLSVNHYYPPFAVYTDDGADHVLVTGNVLLRNQVPFGGVAPGRVRITGNYSDDLRPTWYGDHRGVVLSGNTPLPRADPAGACRADARCARISDRAGRR